MKQINLEARQIKNLWHLILLHLLPGAIVMGVFVLIVELNLMEGYPRIILLSVAGMFGIAATQLGILMYVSKKEENSFNFFKILGLRSKMKPLTLVCMSLGILVVAGLITTLMKDFSALVQDTVFGFYSEAYNLSEDMSGYSREMLIAATISSFFMITLFLPIVEELYFRGFLMARMKWLGTYGVLLNTALFAVYHFWSPWLIISRVFAFFPLFYLVYKKDSLKLSIAVHCLANFTDVVILLMLLS